MNITKKHIQLSAIAMLTGVAISSQQAHAAAVIYDSFEGAVGVNALNGDTGGLGLTPNTWSNSNFDIASGSIAWGTLPTSGNRVVADAGGTVNIGTGTALNGLLDDGDILWFSVLITTSSNVGNGNDDTGFILGGSSIAGNNTLSIAAGNQALGFTIKNGRLRPGSWDGGGVQRGGNNPAGGPSLANSTDYLVVGRMTFAANGNNDLIEIFLPGTDLVLPGSAVTSWTDDLDQTTFDTISFARKGDGNPRSFDEIRFGATYDDVIGVVPVVVPEPSSTALIGLGGLAFILRRRR